MAESLNIVFYWHMHQPLYKDPADGEYVMPWVLYHSTKDYYDMVAILEEFPEVHQTFNIVPSLIEQINDYSSGAASDKYLRISATAASELDTSEKLFILRNFFQANWEHMVMPFERYWELLKKRGFSPTDAELSAAARYFSDSDFLDLQICFNLAWIDPWIRETEEELRRIIEKGRNFSEEDKRVVLAKQIEITQRILPKYAEMNAAGVIELTTSPYYHPIMPILCDSNAALVAMPNAKMPSRRLQVEEDARVQLKRAIKLHEQTFGTGPRGIWPSEGSVSPEILPLLDGEGIDWIATDEEILERSMEKAIKRDKYGHCKEPLLYRPYKLDAGDGGEMYVIFRDHVLSDLIGFEYARWEADEAIDDFTERLGHIYGTVDNPSEHLVAIILDGENAWETYPGDGRDFLRGLYTRLTEDERFKCTTVSEFLETDPPAEKLPRIYPGSWINHNFKVWIGHREDNTAWEYIAEARDALIEFEGREGSTPEGKRRAAEAWESIYAAEGSDWFWWYGDDHATANSLEFDGLFRGHIKKVYQNIGKETPARLEVPIVSEETGFTPPKQPSGFISPIFDGEVTNYYEWLGAGLLKRSYVGGAMHKTESSEDEPGAIIEDIFYGFDPSSLFLRFDYSKAILPYPSPWRIKIDFIDPVEVRCIIEIEGERSIGRLYRKDGDNRWIEHGKLERIASGEVVEIAVDFALLDVKGGEELKFFIEINGGKMGAERRPAGGFVALEVPTEDYERLNWMV